MRAALIGALVLPATAHAAPVTVAGGSGQGVAGPTDLAWGEDGVLYVTDHLRAAISAVTLGPAGAPGPIQSIFQDPLTGLPFGAPVSPMASPSAVVFDGSGTAWVTDNASNGGGALWRIRPNPLTKHPDPQQATMAAAFTDPQGTSLRPDALAIDGKGNLYVGMIRSGEIARVSGLGLPQPTVERDFARTLADGEATAGLAVDNQGNLLVVEGTDITKVDLGPGGGPSPRVAAGYLGGAPLGPMVSLGTPTDIAVTPDALYVLDDTRVARVPLGPGGVPDPVGATIFMEGGINNGGGLALDQAGRTRPSLTGVAGPTLFMGQDPSAGNAAIGSVLASDIPISSPGLRIPAPDTLPPTVDGFTVPGGVLKGLVAVAATASDDVTVAGVDILADGAPVAAAVAAPAGFTATLDTRIISDGRHTLSARARDLAGNVGTRSRSAVVDNVPPVVELTRPGLVTGPRPVLRARAQNAGTGVTRVQFLVDGAVVGADTAPPYAFALRTPLRLGAHRFRARVVAPGYAPVLGAVRRAVVEPASVIPGPAGLPVFPAMTRGTNPFRTGGARTFDLAFRLPRAGRLEVTFTNRAGVVVRTLAAGRKPVGAGVAVRWSGRDETGTLVPAGRYRYRVALISGVRRQVAVGAVTVRR